MPNEFDVIVAKCRRPFKSPRGTQGCKMKSHPYMCIVEFEVFSKVLCRSFGTMPHCKMGTTAIMRSIQMMPMGLERAYFLGLLFFYPRFVRIPKFFGNPIGKPLSMRIVVIMKKLVNVRILKCHCVECISKFLDFLVTPNFMQQSQCCCVCAMSSGASLESEWILFCREQLFGRNAQLHFLEALHFMLDVDILLQMEALCLCVTAARIGLSHTCLVYF